MISLAVAFAAVLALVPTSSAVHGPATVDPNLACEPKETYHVYYGSGSIRVGIWHVLRPTTGITQFNDGNAVDDCGATGASVAYSGSCGQYPWSDPLTYNLPGSGWCDTVPADFDYDLDYSIGGGFFPGGPWATDPICDYGYFPHHGAVPEIDDIAYPPLTSGAPAAPAFSWGADDTDGPLYIPTTDPWDAAFGDGQTCFTDGSITPDADADDWLQLCFGDAGQSGTTCIPPTTLNTYPAAGGDGGFVAFTLTAVTADTGYFDWVPNPLYDPNDPTSGAPYLHDHGGYQTTCDPTHVNYVPGSACHNAEIPKEVFVTVAGTITS